MNLSSGLHWRDKTVKVLWPEMGEDVLLALRIMLYGDCSKTVCSDFTAARRGKQSMDKTDITIASYNKSADRFAEKFMDFESYKSKFLDFQKRYLQSSKTILDLGCGPGNLSKLLFDADSSYEITGIDLSEEMIRLAKENVPFGTFIVSDLRNIGSLKKSDAVIASFCIVHLSDEEAGAFLETMCGLINPGGFLYLSFMSGSRSGYETTCFSDNDIYFNYFDKHTISGILESCSMTVLEIIEDEYHEQDGQATTDVFIFAQKKSEL